METKHEITRLLDSGRFQLEVLLAVPLSETVIGIMI